jgi:hypothetical protein
MMMITATPGHAASYALFSTGFYYSGGAAQDVGQVANGWKESGSSLTTIGLHRRTDFVCVPSRKGERKDLGGGGGFPAEQEFLFIALSFLWVQDFI